MPVIIPEKLPAYRLLKEDKIFVMSEERATTQDIRPLKICIFNLMPDKITTETQILKKLSNSVVQIEITLLATDTHESKNTSLTHLQDFYKSFGEIKDQYFDGMIITGAPVEHLTFEEVDYWPELQEILDWTSTHVFHTLFICWGSQAALYHFYGIGKTPLPHKLFGVYPHTSEKEGEELFLGMNPVFYLPQSRHTESDSGAIRKNKNLTVIASGRESGLLALLSTDKRRMFLSGHPEYERETLNQEYLRDSGRKDVRLPANYFVDDNPEGGIIESWRSDGSLFYQNWLNYYVYQNTDYDWTTKG